MLEQLVIFVLLTLLLHEKKSFNNPYHAFECKLHTFNQLQSTVPT
jgi:hypothetical protein